MNKLAFSILFGILIAIPLVLGQATPDYGNVIIVRNTSTTLEISVEPSFIEASFDIDKFFGGYDKNVVKIKNPNTDPVRVEISASEDLFFSKNNFTLEGGEETDLEFLIFTAQATEEEGKRESFGIIFHKGDDSISKSSTVKYHATVRDTETIRPGDVNITASAGEDTAFSFSIMNPYEDKIEVLLSNPDTSIITLSEDRIELGAGESKLVNVNIDTSEEFQKELHFDVIYKSAAKSITLPVKANIVVTGGMQIIWIVLIALVIIAALIFIFRKKKLKSPADRILDEI